MEKSTPIGLATGLVLIYGAIFLGAGWTTFFDPASLLLVLGGTSAALMVNYPFAQLKQLPSHLKQFFNYQPPECEGYIEQFSTLARLARRDGLLALDRQVKDIEDELMCFGLEMAVDGTEEEELSDMMNRRIRTELQQRQLLAKFCSTAGTYAPAFGMIGTLIGLIQMMQNLNDPAQIGAGMATAMITTFYGALIANLIFLPIGAKAKMQVRETLKARQIIHTGVLSIVRGENPSMVERRLLLFIYDGQDGTAPAEAAAEAAPLSRAA